MATHMYSLKYHMTYQEGDYDGENSITKGLKPLSSKDMLQRKCVSPVRHGQIVLSTLADKLYMYTLPVVDKLTKMEAAITCLVRMRQLQN